MTPWEIIKQLESTNSRLDKERILQSVLLTMPEGYAYLNIQLVTLDLQGSRVLELSAGVNRSPEQ